MSVTISALSGVTPAAIILFQSIMFHWLGFAQAPGQIQAAGSRTVVAEQSAEKGAEKGAIEEGFTSLFNGSSLDGWEQKNGTATFALLDGTICGRTAAGSPNSFLCSKREYSDFELRFEVKSDVGLNTGIQIRSLSKPEYKNGRVHGPQVEIVNGPGKAGYIFSEGTGRKWISPKRDIHDHYRNDGWNKYVVIADGARIQTWVNGHPIEDIETADVEPRKGFFGLQVHAVRKNKSFKVQWRNIRVKELEGTEMRTVKAFKGTPTIDGKIDDIWKSAPRIKTDRAIDDHLDLPKGEKPSTAWARTLWDDGHLYVLMEVTDSKISVDNDEPYETDSIEIFVDGNLSKGGTYDDDDGQYRTDAKGTETVGSNEDPENYQSKVSIVDGGYVVEARIKMDTKAGKKIGFDLQVNNDAGELYRQSTMKWNDPSNETYYDLSQLGELEMVEKK